MDCARRLFARCFMLLMNEIYPISELLKSGMTPSEVRAAVTDGRLVRLRRGVYGPSRQATPWDEHRRAVRAAMKALGPGGVVSHESAAVLQGMWIDSARLGIVHVTSDGPSHGRNRGGLRMHQAPLSDADIEIVDGIACTSGSRTAIDLARTNPLEWGVAACDSATHLGLTTPDSLRDALERGKGLRGAPRARLAVSLSDRSSESPLESVSRVLMWQAGLPDPVLQYALHVDGRLLARFDFGWEEFRLAGEADGAEKYRDGAFGGGRGADAIMREKRRENAVREAGWQIVRWDWATVRNPAALEKRVATALRYAGWTPGPSRFENAPVRVKRSR